MARWTLYSFMLGGLALCGCNSYSQVSSSSTPRPVAATTNQPVAGRGFPIVQNGRVLAAVVLPADPTAVETYAAQELVEHVEKVSGVKLAILKEGEATQAPASSIFIGQTKALQQALEDGAITLQEWRQNPAFASLSSSKGSGKGPFAGFPVNGFMVCATPQALFLAGRDDKGDPLNDTVSAGSLFATYEWLEKQLGIRWIWPGRLGTHLPRTTAIFSGAYGEQDQPPVLSSQMMRFFEHPLFRPAEGGYTPQQRQQVMHDETVWYRRNRFARGANFSYGGHAFEEYWSRFGTTHPEYFNLLPDGTRRPATHPRVISMSVANPGFQRQVIEDWKASRTAARPWINATENDAAGQCVCAECLAWDVPDPDLATPWADRVEHARRSFQAGERLWFEHLGSVSDRYARYYRELQRLGQETDPQAAVIAYGYLNYRNPPISTKLNRNIVIGLIPESPAPFSYLWPISYPDFEKQWLGWNRSGASLFLRPNYMLSGHEQPLLFPNQIAKFFQLAYKNGLVATNYDSLTSMWSTQGPNNYVAARLHWRPDWPVEKILDEYYALFGPAAAEVRTYFDFWQERSKQQGDGLLQQIKGPYEPYTRDLVLKWAHFYRVASLIFTPDDYATAERHLDAARTAAKGNTEALQRVAFLEAGLKDAKLVAQASAIELQLAKTGDRDGMSRIVNELDEHRRQFLKEFPQAINLDLAVYNENRSWDRPLYRALAATRSAVKLPDAWTLRWDTQQQGVRDEWFKGADDKTAWTTVSTTATWENQEAGRQWKAKNGKDYDGWAWYRVNFDVDANSRGRRLSLLFGAVDEAATVYLNGREVGTRTFSKPDDVRTPFFVDITDGLKFGEKNQLTVLVKDSNGDGGIWKPVWLVERKPAGQ